MSGSPSTNQTSGGEDGLGDNLSSIPSLAPKAREADLGLWARVHLSNSRQHHTRTGQVQPLPLSYGTGSARTLDALVNNGWSVARPRERPNVNQMLLQYFVTYQRQLLKFSYSNGAIARFGGNYQNVSAAWQYSGIGRQAGNTLLWLQARRNVTVTTRFAANRGCQATYGCISIFVLLSPHFGN